MTSPPVTRAQACERARAVLARALDRIAADYAAGRLSPEDAAWVEEMQARTARTIPAHRAAA